MQDGACDQVGKVGDEQYIMDEVVFFDFALIGVHQESDLGEGEEGNTQRQHDFAQIPVCAGKTVDVAYEEIGVFVVTQQQQIDGNSQDEQLFRSLNPESRIPNPVFVILVPQSSFLASRSCLCDPHPEGVIAHDGTQQQPDIGRIPVAVEEQRGQCKPAGGKGVAGPCQPEKSDQDDGQVEKNEAV
jgi:hypothetical protein